MRVGIIGPMDEEVSLITAALEDKHTEVVGGRDYIVGTYQGHEVVLVKSGIGKVCAATAAAVLSAHFKVEILVNTGCAGGIGEGLKIGDIVLSTQMAYHDFDLKVFGYQRGQVPSYEQYFQADHALIAKAQAVANTLKQEQGFEPNIFTGVVLSGDQFISDKQKCLDMKADFPHSQVTEMEGAAVAQVCTDFKVPCLVIRSVSDTAQGEAPEIFEQFVQLAADNSAKLVLALIAAL